MMGWRWLAIALAGIVAPPFSASAQQASQGLELVDYTDDFDRVWESTKTLPGSQRVAAFEAAFANILPGFYDSERIKDFIPKERYDELIAKGLKDYPEKRAGIQRVSREFGALIAPSQQSFEAAFGPMRGYPSIYLVN